MLKKLAYIKKFADNGITFNEAEHKYKVLGNDISLSVSQALKKLMTHEETEKFNSKEFQEFLKPYAEYGTRIHKFTEMIDLGIALPSTAFNDTKTKEAIEKYCNSVNDITKADYGIAAIELPIYSFKYDLVGTIDRLFYNDITKKFMLVDIKTGSTRDSHWQQQLIYAKILEEWGIKVNEICLISLKNKNKNIYLYKELKDEKRAEIEFDVAYLLSLLEEEKNKKESND